MSADESAARAWPWGALLAALVVLSTGHRFANGFVFDDEEVIREGGVIHDPSRLADVWTHHTMIASAADPGGVQSVDTYRPLTLTLFFLDAQLSGRSPLGYHATNLLLHLACALLVFALGLVWLGRARAGPACYGAAVFAVHPWLVEAHVWINGRSDPLALALGLASMLVLLRAERAGGARVSSSILAAALFLLGLLSKETLLCCVPAVLLMPPPHGAARRRADLLHRALAVLGASLLYLGLRAAVLEGLRTHRDAAMLGEAAARLPWLLADALRQALAPGLPHLRSLRDEYASLEAWQLALASLLLAGVAVLAWRARRASPLAAWSALWFFAPVVPVAILTTVLWPGFGRYLYLPVAGLAWAVAELAARVTERARRPALLRALAALHVGVLAVMAALFTRDFASSESLYGAAIAARPDVAMGHGWLGIARLDRGDAAGAVGPLSRAAELDPETHRYLIRAGRAALALSDRARAAELADRGIARFRARPEEAAYRLLAVNAMVERDPPRAVGHMVECLRVFPDREDCADALAQLVRSAPDAAENRAALGAALERETDAALAARLRALLE